MQTLLTIGDRNLRPIAAAEFLGMSVRTLEEWRRSWRVAEQHGDSSLRRGSPFHKWGGNRVTYKLSDLDAFRATMNGD